MDFAGSDGCSVVSAFMITDSLTKTMTASLVRGYDPNVSELTTGWPICFGKEIC